MYKASLILLMFVAGCGFSSPLQSNNDLPDLPRAELVAFKYIDYHERKNRAELKEVLGVDPVQTEWCAAFVNAVLKESGIPGSESVSTYPLTARSFLKWGHPVGYPEPGDVVVFPRGNVAWQGHVGFYMRSITIAGEEYYYILGGNQKNKVSIELYRAELALAVRRYPSV